MPQAPIPHATTDILIAGTGFAGIAAAIRLRQAGFTSVQIIEKAADIGGTWRDNTYPGCACDIPSHLYSLSFAQNASWSRLYPQQPELLAYTQNVVAKYNLRPVIRFGTELQTATWDGAAARWRITTSTGPITARILIAATGGLHIPATPQLPGLATFTGKIFHSAQWDHSHDLTGKKIAVIGTGASAIQFIPQIAPTAAKLTIFQRTPAWVIPKPDRPFGRLEKSLLGLPPYRAAFRKYLFYSHELRVLAFLGNKRALKLASALAASHLARQIQSPELREKLTPNYQIGCKRIMISNDYYPALERPNVELVTAPIAEIRPGGVVDSAGAEHQADTIILGTGFQVTTAYRRTAITGLTGQTLGGLWDRTGMAAFNGIAIAGFPNYFMLLGPHTALGHNSVVIMIEAQVGYIVDALKKMRAADAQAIDVTQASQQKFLASLRQRLAGTVWQDGGCDSWYKDSFGQVTTIWPASAAAYRRAVKTADLQDYTLLATQATATA